MGMLVRGNSKLGKDIWQFSVPAIDTCPGATAKCKSICYAARYQKRFKNTRIKYEKNLVDFNVNDMIIEIHDVGAKVVRIHVAGDFYDEKYTNKWVEVIKACPHVTFYAYTRSFMVPNRGLLKSLVELRDLPNMTLWMSIDDTTLPEGKLIYHDLKLAVIGDGSPLPHNENRRVIICPEQTKKASSCSECKLCFSRKLKNNCSYIINFLPH